LLPLVADLDHLTALIHRAAATPTSVALPVVLGCAK